MTQLLRLQPSAGQNVPLTAETSDIAVALRYTSALDPSEEKTVYRSPYVYLTDAGFRSVTTGQLVEIPFHLENVGEILGLQVVSTGPIAAFDNAVIYNYAGEGTDGASPLSVTALAESFTASGISLTLEGKGDTVTPALFRFVTAPEEASAGAGTAGKAAMTVNYVDARGFSRSMTVDDLFSYRKTTGEEAEAVVRPGSTTEIVLQLSNAAYLDSVVVSAGDRWLISSVSAELTPPGDSPSVSSVTVNNWASDAAPLTIDLRPAAQGGESQGNQIQTFTVTARGRKADIAASASSGGTVLVTAYPGDTVDLTPTVTAVGQPDTTWSWNMGDYAEALTVNRDQSAAFRVPGGMKSGDSCTFSVFCNGDNRLSVAVTVMVEEEKEEAPVPAPSGSDESGDSLIGGSAEGSDSLSADGDAPAEPSGTPREEAGSEVGDETKDESANEPAGEPEDEPPAAEESENSTEPAEEALEES